MNNKEKVFCIPEIFQSKNWVEFNLDSQSIFSTICNQNGCFFTRESITDKFEVIPYIIIQSNGNILVKDIDPISVGFEISLLEKNWNGKLDSYIYNSLNQFIDTEAEIRGKIKLEKVGFLKENKKIFYIVAICIDSPKEEFARLKNNKFKFVRMNENKFDEISKKISTEIGFKETNFHQENNDQCKEKISGIIEKDTTVEKSTDELKSNKRKRKVRKTVKMKEE